MGKSARRPGVVLTARLDTHSIADSDLREFETIVAVVHSIALIR